MKKARSWFWLLVQLLPLFGFAFFMFARWGQGTAQFASMSALTTDFAYFAEGWSFEPVYDGLNSVFSVMNVNINEGMVIVLHLASYEVFVLFCRICYEVIAFLPKFCISFFERKM